MDIQSLALMHTLFTNLMYLKVPYWLLTQQCRNRAGNHVTIIQVKNARIKLPKLQKKKYFLETFWKDCHAWTFYEDWRKYSSTCAAYCTNGNFHKKCVLIEFTTADKVKLLANSASSDMKKTYTEVRNCESIDLSSLT